MNRRNLLKFLSVFPFCRTYGSELTERQKIKNLIDGLDKNIFTVYHVKSHHHYYSFLFNKYIKVYDTRPKHDNYIFWGYALQQFNFEQLKQKCSTNEKTLIIVDDYEWFAFDQLFSIDSLTGV